MFRQRHLSPYGLRALALMMMAMAGIVAIDAAALMPGFSCVGLAIAVIVSGIGTGIARDANGRWSWW